MVRKSTLQQVYFDNIRDNQIGGETNGISPEVAADIGYHTPEQLTELFADERRVALGAVRRLRSQLGDTKQLPNNVQDATLKYEQGRRDVLGGGK